jgi:hypothetical protein
MSLSLDAIGPKLANVGPASRKWTTGPSEALSQIAGNLSRAWREGDWEAAGVISAASTRLVLRPPTLGNS